jgi:DNA-binding NarL/FixJ family response regulator
MVGDTPLGVVLQHRNRLLRDLLTSHLAREPAVTLVGSVVSGNELVQLCNVKRPDVAVFEADAPRWSNDRLVSLMRAARPDLRIIGVHESLPAANVIRAYRSGVSALVLYMSGLNALISAIVTPSVTLGTARSQQTSGNPLTDREMEVVYLLSAGYSSDHAAWLMGITQHTLERHRRQIFVKLDVRGQAHAAATALKLGLTEPPSRPKELAEYEEDGPPFLTVAIRGPAGEMLDKVRKALDHHDILTLPEDNPNSPLPPSQEGRVTVLVVADPAQVDWESIEDVSGLVMVVTEEAKRQRIAESWARGVGVVPASRVDRLLPAAVRAAGHGHLIVDAAYSRIILAPGQRVRGVGSPRWLLTLTPREQEILLLMARGHSMKQTARTLGISVRTVENLQSNLFRKLRVHSRAAALVAANELGLLDDLTNREQRASPDMP